ncbi:MAG: S41 family peptidase [Planctomycetaceae bacterium]
MSASRHLRPGLFFLCAGLSVALALTPSRAGNPSSRPLTTEIRQAVNRGVELEQSRKWADAIMHYEKSCRQWPECGELEYGMRRSKVHLSVDRRYSDRSFERNLLVRSRSEAMGLFEDIYRRTQSQYVEPVSLTSFVAHGTESLYQALDEPRFLARHVPDDRRGRAEEVRNVLRRPGDYWNRRVADFEDARRFVEEVANLCQRELAVPPTAVWLEYVFGGCHALDDYSGLLTPGRYTDLMSNIHGNFVGLGVEIKAEPGQGMFLVNVLPGSPAAEGGLLKGEFITTIDGTDVTELNTDEAANLLQGEAGSKVRLEIRRGKSEDRRTLVLARRPVEIQSIPVAEIVDRPSGVGYIQLTTFQDSTARELDQALARLDQQGMQSLILDVRGNPGGLLSAAVEVLDRFLAEGTLVQIRGPRQNETFTAKQPGTWTLPVVLLIDGDSASASEIVAGAFKDHRRGTIVGRRSFGKWSVQTIFQAKQQCGLRVTTAKFYSPRGQNLAKVGLRPDIEVPEPPADRQSLRSATEIDIEGDEDLRQALRLLRNDLAAR